jgi:hypothetical protein
VKDREDTEDRDSAQAEGLRASREAIDTDYSFTSTANVTRLSDVRRSGVQPGIS